MNLEITKNSIPKIYDFSLDMRNSIPIINPINPTGLATLSNPTPSNHPSFPHNKYFLDPYAVQQDPLFLSGVSAP